MMSETLTHCAAALAGFACVYCGLFLYEEEELSLHNRLDMFWTHLNQKSKEAVAIHADILRTFAALTLTVFNKICGERNWTSQNFMASICISTTSVALFAIIGAFYYRHEIPQSSVVGLYWGQGQVAFVFTTLFFLPLLIKTPQMLSAWKWLVFTVWVVQYAHTNGSPEDVSVDGLINYFAILFAWAFLIPLLMVFHLLSKRVLDAIRDQPFRMKSICVLSVYFTLLVATIVAIRENHHFIQNPDRHGTFYISSSNMFVIALMMLSFFGSVWLSFALIIFLSLVLLFMHSAIWAGVNRPLYAMSRHKLFNRHKTFVGLGLALFAFAFKIPALIKEIFQTLLG